MMNIAFRPVMVALAWVPIFTFLGSHFVTSDAVLFALVGGATFVGVAVLSLLHWSDGAIAIAMAIYAVSMPFFLLFGSFVFGLATGHVKIGHI
jgi:hypothetical protein